MMDEQKRKTHSQILDMSEELQAAITDYVIWLDSLSSVDDWNDTQLDVIRKKLERVAEIYSDVVKLMITDELTREMDKRVHPAALILNWKNRL